MKDEGGRALWWVTGNEWRWEAEGGNGSSTLVSRLSTLSGFDHF